MVEKWTILGQDPDVIKALIANLISWFVTKFFPSLLPHLLPKYNEEVEERIVSNNDIDILTNSTTTSDISTFTRCISIGRPGGSEQLRLVTLKKGIVTVGYNLKQFCLPPFTPPITTMSVQPPSSSKNNNTASIHSIPPNCVILHNQSFSINYADCCIRWGLYESAKRFVGWPIVPGFDVAGIVEHVSSTANDDININNSTNTSSSSQNIPFQKGDQVFGCTLFGAYSSHILVPTIQLRKIPKGLSFAEAASLPAVSLTALYALMLSGHYPNPTKYTNKAILIHSAAGGVGSMLVQMSKILGLNPIVGVVGSHTKVEEAKALGCHYVIDKSDNQQSLWTKAKEISPNGYSAIMDANGVSTLQQSYNHLTPTGRLVVFGFHSNLPMGVDMLSPMEWIRMAKKMSSMPKFDPMDLVTENKSVLGFNLSFFAEETEIVSDLFDQIVSWLENGLLRCPKIITMDVEEIAEAHALIQSGSSVGKIVINI